MAENNKRRKKDSAIPVLTKRIIKVYKPSKIILFGSYAYGKPTEDSDIDILVVTNSRESSAEVRKKKEKIARGFSIPIQLVFVCYEEFIETKDVIGGITYPAAKYGKVLYEKS